MSARWAWLSAVLLVIACDEAGSDVPDCNDGQEGETCEVFRIVNAKRTEAGRQAYRWNLELAEAAQLHAEDMVEQGYFSHTSKDGREFDARIRDAGYDGSPRAENIAMGQTTPEQVMDSWMNSQGHRENILAEGSNEIGVGFHNNTWVQTFGSRM